MFSGPYMITKVTHTINESGFETKFDGTRQPFYSLPSVENFLQTLNEKLVSQLQTKVKENEQISKAKSENVKIQAENTIANLNSEDKLTQNQDCAAQINNSYAGFVGVDTPQQTTVSTKVLMSTIEEVLSEQGLSPTGLTYQNLISIIFTFVYVDSGTESGSSVKAYENNYSTINLTEVYSDKFFEYINRKYFCVSRGSNPNLPIVVFRSLKDFIKFVYTRVGNIPRFLNNDLNDFSQFGQDAIPFALAKEYVLYYPTNQNENVYKQIEADPNQITKLRQEFVNAFNQSIAILKQ
jgi:hypothetical protein